MKKKRIRDIPLHIMLSEKELEQLQNRMVDAGIINRNAFVRKMLLGGYILHVDLSPLKELISLQRRCVNNLNQIMADDKVHEAYSDEFAALQKGYADLWEKLPNILKCFTAMMSL